MKFYVENIILEHLQSRNLNSKDILGDKLTNIYLKAAIFFDYIHISPEPVLIS